MNKVYLIIGYLGSKLDKSSFDDNCCSVDVLLETSLSIAINSVNRAIIKILFGNKHLVTLRF